MTIPQNSIGGYRTSKTFEFVILLDKYHEMAEQN